MEANLILTPKNPNLVFDVGMHKGEDTEFYLRKGFKVVAFEANPDLVKHCQARFEDYLTRGQLVIVAGAVVEPGILVSGQKKIIFYRNEVLSVWGTICPEWADRNIRLGTTSNTIEVDVIDFGAVIQEHGVPHFMKIDIEGCDLACLETIKQFESHPDYISIESDKTGFSNIKQEISLFTELGYDSFKAVEQSELHIHQTPPNPALEGRYVEHRFEDGSSGLFGAELSGVWSSANKIRNRYRVICFVYFLLGDDGVINRLKFRGAGRLQSFCSWALRLFTRAPVPGWYDTHARHSTAAPNVDASMPKTSLC